MAVARELLHQIYRPGYRYKKTGIQLAHLVSEEEYQPELFDRPSPTIHVDKIVDEINRRLGDPKNPVITRAAQGTLRSGKGWRMRAERHSPHYTTDLSQVPEAKA
jgi:DNA polymerase V